MAVENKRLDAVCLFAAQRQMSMTPPSTAMAKPRSRSAQSQLSEEASRKAVARPDSGVG
jgi:hypothetical protein